MISIMIISRKEALRFAAAAAPVAATSRLATAGLVHASHRVI